MQPSKSSIGVELEFLLAVAETPESLTVPQMFQSAKGSPLVTLPESPISAFNDVKESIERTIEKALVGHRGSRVIQSDDEVENDQEAYHLKYYTDWAVGSDFSILFPGKFKTVRGVHGYTWIPVEVTSPALWATEESWDEIRAVVQAINDKYWILTSETAGLHFHYGNGKEYIPLEKLRRMAALFIAADPLIAQLQPPHRRTSCYCICNRHYSRVAHGTSAKDAANCIRAEFVEAEPEIPAYLPRPVPTHRLPYSRAPGLEVPFRRGHLETYEFDEFQFKYLAFEKVQEEKPKPADIPHMARQILRCQNAPTVAELMRTSPMADDRPAYSFHNYLHGTYKTLKRVRNEIDGEVIPDDQSKRTVEFRQMASTMVPEEVLAHGKIIVRLCEFAAEADITKFWGLVLDCAFADENKGWYDVFDLLADLGLITEANALVKSVAEFRGDDISPFLRTLQSNGADDEVGLSVASLELGATEAHGDAYEMEG